MKHEEKINYLRIAANLCDFLSFPFSVSVVIDLRIDVIGYFLPVISIISWTSNGVMHLDGLSLNTV